VSAANGTDCQTISNTMIANTSQTDVFAQGKVAQMIAVPGAAELIAQANPALKDKIGFFPIPGKTADKPGAVFTGGSDLIIPEASANQDAAYTFTRNWPARSGRSIRPSR
jgi:N,N'-diacetylchitobiose transport system substrate-binding protein